MGVTANFDVEIHDDAPARYCARGVYDVLWTDDLDAALVWLKGEILRLATV